MTPRGPLGGFTLERFSALDGTLWSALLGEWWNLLRLGGNPLCSGSGGEGADFTSAVNESLKCSRERASPFVSKILGWIGFGAWITQFRLPVVVDVILRFFSLGFPILSVC